MISIFLTNLGKYNEGTLIGNWYKLPLTREELEKAFLEIGLNEQYEEYFITDYETDLGIEIHEYENIYELNNMANKLKELATTSEIKALLEASIIDIRDLYEKDIFELRNEIEKYSFISLDDTVSNQEREFGEVYVDEIIGGLANLSREDLEYYFNFEQFGRDKLLNGAFISSNNTGVI